MKKLVMFVLVLVAATAAFDYATGTLGIVSSGNDTADEGTVRALEGRFVAAKRDLNQAMRTSGLSGLDTTGDVEAVREEVIDIHSEVVALIPRLTVEQDKERAARLEAGLKKFRTEMRW